MGGEGARRRARLTAQDSLVAVLAPPPCSQADGAPAFLASLAGDSAESGPWDVAVRGGLLADRLGYAFIAGYQAALSALIPSRDRRPAALCATEDGGAHPRAIATRVDEGRLNGAKTFVTLGEQAEQLFVLAKEGEQAGRPQLALLGVDRNADGVVIEPMPPMPFVPEIPHARVRFSDVRTFERLPGDGFGDYVRPFRTVEDVHVHTAFVAWLTATAGRHGWSRAAITRGASLLTSLRDLSARDPSSPATHVALAGAIDAARALGRELEPAWASAPEEARARWQRDRPLLEVAAKARAARLERAWSRLGAPG